LFWCSFEVDNRGELSLVGLLIKVEFDSINHTSEMSKRKNIRDTSVLERSTAFTSLDRLDMRINISSGSLLFIIGLAVSGPIGTGLALVGLGMAARGLAIREMEVFSVRPNIIARSVTIDSLCESKAREYFGFRKYDLRELFGALAFPPRLIIHFG
jgi:hypothetical protein